MSVFFINFCYVLIMKLNWYFIFVCFLEFYINIIVELFESNRCVFLNGVVVWYWICWIRCCVVVMCSLIVLLNLIFCLVIIGLCYCMLRLKCGLGVILRWLLMFYWLLVIRLSLVFWCCSLLCFGFVRWMVVIC